MNFVFCTLMIIHIILFPTNCKVANLNNSAVFKISNPFQGASVINVIKE